MPPCTSSAAPLPVASSAADSAPSTKYRIKSRGTSGDETRWPKICRADVTRMLSHARCTSAVISVSSAVRQTSQITPPTNPPTSRICVYKERRGRPAIHWGGCEYAETSDNATINCPMHETVPVSGLHVLQGNHPCRNETSITSPIKSSVSANTGHAHSRTAPHRISGESDHWEGSNPTACHVRWIRPMVNQVRNPAKIDSPQSCVARCAASPTAMPSSIRSRARMVNRHRFLIVGVIAVIVGGCYEPAVINRRWPLVWRHQQYVRRPPLEIVSRSSRSAGTR